MKNNCQQNDLLITRIIDKTKNSNKPKFKKI
jgi:hypothetical protein